MIKCETKELYSNGKIYLADCTVNGTRVDYTYGIESSSHLAKENVETKTLDTVTTGIVPTTDENGNIVVVSEFKIKVNEEIGFLTFFVLSNDLEYVNLIAQKNLALDGSLAGENQTGNEWYVISSTSYSQGYWILSPNLGSSYSVHII